MATMLLRQHGRLTLVPRIQYGDSTVPLSKDTVIAAPIVAVVMLLAVAISWFAWRRCVKNQKPPVRFEPGRTTIYRPPEGRENDPELPPYSPNELPAYERDVAEAGALSRSNNEMPQQEGIELQDVGSTTLDPLSVAREPDGSASRVTSTPEEARIVSQQPTANGSDHQDPRRPDPAHIVHTP